jgi:hypothetical protein
MCLSYLVLASIQSMNPNAPARTVLSSNIQQVYVELCVGGQMIRSFVEPAIFAVNNLSWIQAQFPLFGTYQVIVSDAPSKTVRPGRG